MPDKAINAPSLKSIEGELKSELRKIRRVSTLQRTLYALLIVVSVTVIISLLFLPVVRIIGASMSTTLEDGDVVIAVNDHRFETGDVIAFHYNNSILIKRVIAGAGDWVDIDEDGTVYVNGKRLDEPYVEEPSMGLCDIRLPYQVPDKKCFVMGDHRATSVDSRNRSVGCIGNEAVVGKLLWRIWPLEQIGSVH